MKPRLFMLNLILDMYGEDSFYCISLCGNTLQFQGKFSGELRDKISLLAYFMLEDTGFLCARTEICEFKLEFTLTHLED